MAYSIQDYLLEQKKESLKQFPKIVYKKQTTANKNHICEMCGKEIHKGELIWWYKPRPLYNLITKVKTYFKWRKRCIDCEPKSYEELKELERRLI